ncbi:unnamed protein product [Cylicostephanus goldi]|uniref:Serpin domain-containing protein n=1 Tax=Cylicostephanus goldi TaxID=71465 RepID=A0A3P6SQZ0_CYLGO|nr:unnamed protein product [Cylicostephanus goldi]
MKHVAMGRSVLHGQYTLIIGVVDENGTTAAAATYFGLRMRSRRPNGKKFIADHPFIFILTKDKNALFIGQYV